MFPLTPWAGPRSSFVQPVEPPFVDPDEGGLISISFNPAWLPYVLGALTQLTQLTTWIGDDDAKRLAVERATGLMNLIGLPAATSVPGEPPPPTVTTRYNPTTHTVQTTTDGGTTWVDAPGSDPRKNSPLPPQTGTNAACNSAASERKYLTRWVGVLQLTGATGVTATGLGYAILALLLDLSGPWAILFEVIVTASLGLLDAGLTAINIALDDANLDLIECTIFCHLNSSNQLDETRLGEVQADITALIGGTSATIINIILGLQGVGGINSAMALKLDTDDCSGCGCTWCYKFNFLTDDGSFGGTFGGWNPGVGWQSIRDSTNTRLGVTRSVPAGATVTYVRIIGVAGAASGGGSRVVNVGTGLTGGVGGTLPTTTGAFDRNFSGSQALTTLYFELDTAGNQNVNKVTSLELHGTGVNPFGPNNC